MNPNTRDALKLLEWALKTFGDRVEQGTSFGPEGMVLIDLLSRLTDRPRVFTLDTGRLHPQTYRLMEEATRRYNLALKIFYPETRRVEEMVREHGINLFYESHEKRRLCCHVRKVEPLQRATRDLLAWITGLRREDSGFRESVAKVTIGPDGVTKISPLADWSDDDIWDYIRQYDVPYNELHDSNYPSIGCAPCTRPVQPGEDARAGRWWWEQDSKKECGLHPGPGTRRESLVELGKEMRSR